MLTAGKPLRNQPSWTLLSHSTIGSASRRLPVKGAGFLSPLDDVGEQRLLDLEREAFLSLCGLPKTLERMQHTLTTGKPLRN